MTIKQAFVQFIKENVAFDETDLGTQAAEYFEKLQEMKDSSKSDITEKGKEILTAMTAFEAPALAKEIAEAMGIGSRSVSGSMRKLVTDGYVNKVTDEDEKTNKYEITEVGKAKL